MMPEEVGHVSRELIGLCVETSTEFNLPHQRFIAIILLLTVTGPRKTTLMAAIINFQ